MSAVRKLLDNLKRLRGTGSPDVTDSLEILATAVLDLQAQVRCLEGPKPASNNGHWIRERRGP